MGLVPTPTCRVDFQDTWKNNAYSFNSLADSNQSISSWMITPRLHVKNGDQISFYTRGDSVGLFTNRMQVLLNKTGSSNFGTNLTSTGDFSTVLFDINATQDEGGYPIHWTKYDYTFSGISDTLNVRVAFRRFISNPKNSRGGQGRRVQIHS